MDPSENTAAQQSDQTQPPTSYQPDYPFAGIDIPPSVPSQDTLTDEELAALLCDSEGQLITPDVMEANIIDVQRCINKTVGLIIKWCQKGFAQVDKAIQGIVAKEMGKVAGDGQSVSQLIAQLETEIIQWVANKVGEVQMTVGGFTRPPRPTTGAIGSPSSVPTPVAPPTDSQSQQPTQQNASPQGFPLGTAGAGFGGESAVGRGLPRSASSQSVTTNDSNDTANQSLEQLSQSATPTSAPTDPCAGMSDEERAIWGCSSADDVIRLRILGDFRPMLPPNTTLKQWLEDNFPFLRDSRNTPENVF